MLSKYASERPAADDEQVDRSFLCFLDRVVDPTASFILREGCHRQRHRDISSFGHGLPPVLARHYRAKIRIGLARRIVSKPRTRLGHRQYLWMTVLKRPFRRYSQTCTTFRASLLREDDGRVRAQFDGSSKRHVVLARRGRPKVIARLSRERRTVPFPVAVESHSPQAVPWDSDRITRIAARAEVGDYDDVIARAAAIPAVKGNHLIVAIEVKDIDVGTFEARRVVEPVAPEPDQVLVEISDAWEAIDFRPIQLACVRPSAPLKEFLPHEYHRNPRRGEHDCCPQGGTLLRVEAVRITGPNLLRDSRLSDVALGRIVRLAYFVVRFGVDDPLERIVVESLFDEGAQRIHVSFVVTRSDDRVAKAVHEACTPLRTETGTSCIKPLRDPLVLLHVFSDGDLPRLTTEDFRVDPPEQAPAFRDIGPRIVVATKDVPNPSCSIKSQAIAVALLEPAQRVVPNELPHFTPAVIGSRSAPRRLVSPIVVEIDSTLAEFIPAIELPEVQIVRAKVIVDDVEKNGDSAPMRRVDKLPQAVRAGVALFNGEDMRWVVTPGDIAWEFVCGKQLDRIDAEITQVV